MDSLIWPQSSPQLSVYFNGASLQLWDELIFDCFLSNNDLIISPLFQEKEDQNKVLCYLQNTSAASSKLLLTAKPLSLDPSGSQGQLTTASRSLIDALNKLLAFCSASRLVLKECEGALRDVQVWMLVESIKFYPKFNDNHRFSIGLGEHIFSLVCRLHLILLYLYPMCRCLYGE